MALTLNLTLTTTLTLTLTPTTTLSCTLASPDHHPNLHPNPLKVDSSGDWEYGQLIAPPAVAADQPAWLAHLRSWREGCVGSLRLEESPVIFDDPKLRWTQTSFVHVQARPRHSLDTLTLPHAPR